MDGRRAWHCIWCSSGGREEEGNVPEKDDVLTGSLFRAFKMLELEALVPSAAKALRKFFLPEVGPYENPETSELFLTF